MKRSILVTGGTGYIGSHTCVALQQQGYEVIIIDNLVNSHEGVVNQIAAITGIAPSLKKLDLCDRNRLLQFFKENSGIQAVIHFAAYKSVGESTTSPLKYYNNNIMGLINLLEAMKSIECNNLVFSSSCTVYGQPDKLPVSEDAPIKKALSPYGNTKKIAEDIINDQVNTSSLRAISLRYFNPIGAHKSSLIGELPIGEPNNLVPYLTQTAIGKRDVLKVFGNDYSTPDGTGVRDYIHIEDLADAHVFALIRLDKNLNISQSEVFNIGTGNGYSVLEIIKTFERVTGVKVNYKIVDRRPGDIEIVWADSTKANNILGWKAKQGLDEMLLSAWNWEKSLKS
jgi:UDP-glucose 4-epimerase